MVSHVPCPRVNRNVKKHVTGWREATGGLCKEHVSRKAACKREDAFLSLEGEKRTRDGVYAIPNRQEGKSDQPFQKAKVGLGDPFET